jgi:type I restriction enzyme S subunit
MKKRKHNLPSGWKRVRLKEIAIPINDKVGNNTIETLSISAGVGFVNQAKKFGRELSGKQYENYIVIKKGDFSFNKGNSKKFPYGCIYLLKNRDIAAVPNVFYSFNIPDQNRYFFEQLFIGGVLNHQLNKLINTGVRNDGLFNLYESDFYNCSIPLPPLPEQQKIAEILSTADKLIAVKEKLIAAKQKQKRYLMQQLLTGKKRLPGFSGEWRTINLEEACTGFQYGINASATNYNGKDKYLRITDINENTREFSADNITSPNGVLSDEYLLNNRDIVFARTGASVGKTYLYNGNDGRVYFAGFLIRCTVKETFNTRYIYYNTFTDGYTEWVSITSMRSGQPGINAEELRKFEFPIPSSDEQSAITAVLTTADKEIELLTKELEQQKQMKKFLMQQLLTGKIRVKGRVQHED